MPSFRFRALTAEGRTVSGRIEAADERAALDRLKGRGLIPVHARPAGRRGGVLAFLLPRRDRGRLITSLTRELAVLLGAGERLERALATVAEDLADRVARDMLTTVRQQVRSGVALSRALAAFPEFFDGTYVAVVAAGETAGRLPEALGHLAELRERRDRFRRQVSAALLYPSVLLVAGLLSIVFILGFVVPELAVLLGAQTTELSRDTQLVFAASNVLRNHPEHIVGGVLLFAMFIIGIKRLSTVNEFVDRLFLMMPGMSGLFREKVSAEFTRGLAMLLKGGLDLPYAVLLTQGIVTNRYATRALGEVARKLREGRRLTDCLKETGILSPLVLRLLRSAEECGRLPATMAFLANILEERVEERLKMMAYLIEPILIILFGLFISGILSSVFSALLSLNKIVFQF